MQMIFHKKYQADSNEIIEKYSDMVYRIALLQVKNKADAEDIFQEVFIKLIQNMDKLTSEEHVKAWLIRVTINCSKTHLTSYWNKNTVAYDTESTQEAGAEDTYPIEEQAEREKIFQSVKELPDKYRNVIHLFYYEQLSIVKISEVLQEKESTIKSHLFRGRELLRDKLKGDFGNERI